MKLENIQIPAINLFASSYLKQEKPVVDFFHYRLSDPYVFEKRLRELENRTFLRYELASCLEKYMEDFLHIPAVQRSIHKLKLPHSAVVLGGQQAGLMTGPLYTIHKIISVIRFAGLQEEKLGVPIVPVFWIAGEDHDFLEVNHLYVQKGTKMEKFSYTESVLGKKMVSDICFNKALMQKWVEEIIRQFGETEHTNGLLDLLREAIECSETITDFFRYLIAQLFCHYGLLLIDSAFEPLRKLEIPYFRNMILENESITEKVLEQQSIIRQAGFSNMIELSEEAANLFLYECGERILLEYNKEKERFTGKNGEIEMETEHLLDRLKTAPQCFSNNVVTRPIMQEQLFPTLAFIAGPGEIAYWAELKQAFEFLDMKVPPILPRLNITLLERSVARDLEVLGIDVKTAIESGISSEKNQYWDTVRDDTFHDLIETTKEDLMKHYEKIKDRARKMNLGPLSLIEKNLEFHFRQLDYLKKKTDQNLMVKHQAILQKYDRIENSLHPNGGPQERVWNLFYFMNQYGVSFIHDLMELPFTFDGTHQLVKI
ncbi:bacillithiol biosynthesis cysteine-adding enzyme BshC [Bacillus smithii]|uniref:bacillithiol biosynthesis cysteine-adding enzyme BshC n=1 Tax=Bacillus smithii TaxID=1479 RepID=UPI0022E0BF7F|nr:bacillithiol biosynthesis cysteine-adding enzyme BshC [Bacillus smithii]